MADDDPQDPAAGVEKASELHATSEQMERFFRGELSSREARFVVRHLLTQCPVCVGVALSFGQPDVGEAAPAPLRGLLGESKDEGESGRGSHHDAVPESTVRRVVPKDVLMGEQRSRERLHAAGLCAVLERKHPMQRFHQVRKFRRFHRVSLYERLLERCIEEGRQFPHSAIGLAALALAVLDTLEPEQHPEVLVADYRSRALATLGNAKRLDADFDGAHAAFKEARTWLMTGSGDPLEEARIVSLEASLQRDLGAIEQSIAHLDAAIELYRAAGDSHLEGRMIIKRANAVGELEPERAIALLHQGLRLIDPEREPRLKLCARHDMILFLVAAGHPREALHLLDGCRLLYRQFPDAWTRLRLWWVEGRIARGLGDLATAEDTFRAVCNEFDERGMKYELTLVSIDLAEAYAAQKKTRQAVRLLREFGAVLEHWGMHREGLAAWGLLHQATTTEQFLEVARYFSRYWRMPARYVQTTG